jgi:hypothetical protein
MPSELHPPRIGGSDGTRNRRRTAIRLAGMGIAAQLLEETDLRLSEIASRVGYGSEFS